MLVAEQPGSTIGPSCIFSTLCQTTQEGIFWWMYSRVWGVGHAYAQSGTPWSIWTVLYGNYKGSHVPSIGGQLVDKQRMNELPGELNETYACLRFSPIISAMWKYDVTHKAWSTYCIALRSHQDQDTVTVTCSDNLDMWFFRYASRQHTDCNTVILVSTGWQDGHLATYRFTHHSN